MCRGLVSVFQNRCFWVWLPTGSQALDQVLWWILALGLGWLLIPCFGSVSWGSQPLIRLRSHPRFQLWAPIRGFRCARPPRCFLSVCPGSWATYQACAQPEFQVWAPGHRLGYAPTGALLVWCPGSQAAYQVRAHPEFQLWAPSLLIWVCTSRASGEHWGCFSAFTVQGLRGEGRQRPLLLRLLGRVL